MSTMILTRNSPAPIVPRGRVTSVGVHTAPRKPRRRFPLRGKRINMPAPDARVLDLHVRSTSLWPRSYR